MVEDQSEEQKQQEMEFPADLPWRNNTSGLIIAVVDQEEGLPQNISLSSAEGESIDGSESYDDEESMEESYEEESEEMPDNQDA